MKRIIFIILSSIMCLCVSVTNVCAASTSDPTGYDSWSTDDKIAYWISNVGNATCGIIGISSPTIEETITRMVAASEYTKGYDSYADFVAQNSSYDDDTATWTFNDCVISFINELKDEVEEEADYVLGYIPKHTDINANSFSSSSAYRLFYNLVSGHGTYAFYAASTTATIDDASVKVWKVQAFEFPFAGVGSTPKGLALSGTVWFYDDEWANKFECKVLYICDVSSGDYDYMYYYDSDGTMQKVSTASEAQALDLSDVAETNTAEMGAYTYASSVLWSDTKAYVSPYHIFSSSTAGIPIFTSVASMKNCTSSGTVEGERVIYLSNYSSGDVTDNSVTQEEITNYTTEYNTYYYGSTSTDTDTNDDDSSSSGSGWLDTLLSGLGNLGEAIISVIGKLLDIIGDAIKFITDSLTDVTDLISGGFADFLAALFPFIPEEWLTAVTLALSLMVLGIIIRLFKG